MQAKVKITAKNCGTISKVSFEDKVQKIDIRKPLLSV